jgi:hypothetical protein
VDGVPAGDPRTLVIGATLAWPADRRTSDVPATRLLDDAFDVDKDGFLVPRP